MPKIIGLTGGIGSGKSTVAAYFQSMGIPIYIADDEAKKILDSAEVSKIVQQEFGEGIIKLGKIDRKKLAALVFDNPDELRKLNNIIHPAVLQHFRDWVTAHENHQLLIKEAAILFESGSDAACDVIITVTAPINLRIERVIKRDEVSREDVLNRIANQWTDEQRIAKSDFVIENTDIKKTIIQAAKVLKKLHNL